MTRSRMRELVGRTTLCAGLLALIPLSAGSLVSCAGKGDSPWVRGYEPQRPALPDTDEVRVEPAPIDTLEADPSLEGHEVIGISRFTDERQEQDPSDPEGPLVRHAMNIGATLVRVGLRPAGTETRTRYIRTTTPGTEAPGGNIASGRRTAVQHDEIPIEVEVEVYDHVAVFYRKTE